MVLVDKHYKIMRTNDSLGFSNINENNALYKRLGEGMCCVNSSKFDENFKIKEQYVKIVKLLKPLITSLRQGSCLWS